MQVLITIGMLLGLLCASPSQAQMKLHSKIATKTSAAGEQTAVEFKVVPDKDLVINLEGPWSVTVEDNGRQLTKLGRDEFQEKIPGFLAKLATKKGTELKYNMVVFVCTADKKHCYRDVHKNTLKI